MSKSRLPSRVVSSMVVVIGLGGCENPNAIPSDGGGDASNTRDAQAGGELVVHVVEGPGPTHPSVGTTVVADGAAGATATATTDANGVATLTLSPGSAPWTVTAFRTGFSVVSVANVPAGTLDGAIRLDPLTNRDYGTPVAVSGTIAGVGAGNSVQLDAMNFETVPAAVGNYSTRFLFASDLPLSIAAIELDRAGNAVNASITVPVARTMNPATVNITLPSPGRTPTTSTTTIALPSSGLVDRTWQYSQTSGVQRRTHNNPAHEEAWMLVGVSHVQPLAAAGLPIEIQSFDGDLAPDVAFFSLTNLAQSMILNVMAHQFAGQNTISVGTLEQLDLSGTSAADVAISARGDGWDTFSITLEDSRMETPGWRLYTYDGTPVNQLRFPNAAGAWPIALGAISGQPAALAMAIRMRSGGPRAWETRVYNSTMPEYEVQIGGRETPVSPVGR